MTDSPKIARASPQDVGRKRALASVSLNTRLALDQGTSSEDDLQEEQRIPADQAGGVIGVSIGREQTRLTSPTTPAVEKAAAIDAAGGFFDGPVPEDDSLEEHGDAEPRKETAPRKPASSVPSPWRIEPKEPPRTSVTRSMLRDSLLFSRKRSSSGPESSRETWQKALMSSLPSFFSNDSSERSSSPTLSAAKARDDTPTRSLSPESVEEVKVPSPEPHARPALVPIRTRPSQLRRSASESSLQPRRTLSRVSSLGDDSRFEDVHQQVNSRFKAIKDSWHDSSLRRPHLSSIPNLSSLAPDFFRDKGLPLSRRSNNKQANASTASERPADPMTRQPYSSTRAAFADVTADKAHPHPHLHSALQNLEGDVVVLGGYRGSILRSAEPPHRQVWVPVKVGLNLRKVDLEVGLNEGDDEKAKEKIYADGMLTHIGPVDISKRLFKRLRHCANAHADKLRVRDYGYDWRLSPAFLSSQLIRYLEGLPCNQPTTPKHERGAIVIAHSLGGLITRHAVNQRPELFRGVIYAGVPKTCVNILGPLRNGDEVLLSSRVLTAQVNFTIRTSFALLPLDGRCFIDKETKEEYRVDFFDPQTWIDYRLSPCVARPLPPLAPPAKSSSISSYVSSVASALPIPGLRNGLSRPSSPANPSKFTTAGSVAEPDTLNDKGQSGEAAVAHGNVNSSTEGRDPESDTSSSVRTAVTISRDDAIDYLGRTLSSVKKFKQELAFNPSHAAANTYPPVAVIYGKSIPTVFGARVNGREGIKHADAYDNLAFASGDGVVLAKAAMLPEGYTCARGGTVSSERGHVTLLGDLEAVGKCLNAIMKARGRGVGTGTATSPTP